MAERTQLRFSRFRGMDQSMSEWDTPPDSTQDAQNVDVLGGMLTTAKEDEQVFRLGRGPVKSLFLRTMAGPGNLPQSRLYASTETGIFGWDSSAWQEAKVFSPSAGGRLITVNYSLGDVHVTACANGTDPLSVWEGTAPGKNWGEETAFSSVCLHYERLWGTGHPRYPQRVWYANAFSPNDWFGKGSGSIEVYSPEDGRTVAVKSCYNELVVFKEKGIHRIYGATPNEFGVKKVAGDFGPVNPFCILSCLDRVYYMSRQDGICLYDGMRTRPLLDEKLRLFLGNPALRLDTCCGIARGCTLYFSVDEDGDGKNDCIIAYDVLKGDYLLYRGMNADCFVLWEGSVLYGSADGNVYRLFGKENGLARPAHWVTPRTDLGAQHLTKRSVLLYAQAQGKGELSVTADFGERVREKRVTLPETLSPVRVALPCLGRTVRFRFANVAGSSFALHAPQLAMETDEDWV